MNGNLLSQAGAMRQVGLIGLVLLAAIGGGAGYYFWRTPDAAQVDANRDFGKRGGGRGVDDAPAAVAAATVTRGDFPIYLNGLGTVTPLKTVIVRPRVDGELVKVTFSEGQWVKQGELLAEIDPRPFQVQLQQAEGQLLRDQALLKNAQLDLERYQALLNQDSISEQQAVTQAAQVKQYQGLVIVDQAQVDHAKLQLSYTKLTAPIAGRAGLRQIDQGNVVHANDADGLVVITQLQPINVVFALPEDQLPAVVRRWHEQPAIAVEAYDRAGKTQLAQGKLVAIDNQIDANTGTIKLKAQFGNDEQNLFANQFVNVKMLLDTLQAAILLPAAAIQHDGQGAFVYVLGADKKAQLRRVALGAGEGDKAVALDGVNAGDVVVVDGADRVRDGCEVDIARQDGVAVTAGSDAPPKGEGQSHQRERGY